MKIFAVIPAYNEQKIIGQVVSEVKKFVDAVVVVDDGSTDQTATFSKQAGAVALVHPINLGQGAALQTAIDFSLNKGADIIVTFDADGQFLPDEISLVCSPILDGRADVVLGSRFLQPKSNIPKAKNIVLKLAIFFTRLYTGLNITDTHNGFRALNRLAANKINLNQNRMAHASEILEQIKKLNLRYCEAPVTVRYSDYSMQKGQKISNSMKIFWDLFFSRMQK